MKQSKIGILFLTTILALAGITASYAGFTDTIEITGTATTGSVDLDLEQVEGTWAWKNITDHLKIVNYGLATDVDIDGDGDAGDDYTAANHPDDWYNDDNMLLYSYATAFNDTEDEDHFNMKWSNLTPQIEYNVNLLMHYVGKTPARILNEGIIFEFAEDGDQIDMGDGDINWLQWLYENEHLSYEFYFVDEQGNPDYTRPVDECTQLHYCDHILLMFNITIPQLPILQGLDSDFSFTINLIQFDEAEDCDDPCTGSIGDLVWYDANENGIQDLATEEGISGITVNLYSESGILLDSKLTGHTGNLGEYLFTGLQPGNYQVQFDVPSDLGLEFTEFNVGTDNTLDSDANPDNDNKSNIFALTCDGRMDLDAGLIETGTTADEPCVSIQKTLLGSYTDPQNGADVTETTNQIAINASFPTKFDLEICVTNCGDIDLNDVEVNDTIGDEFTIIPGSNLGEDVTWNENTKEIIWQLSELVIGDTECITIPIQTIEAESGIYHPIYSDDETCLTAISPADDTIYSSPYGNEYYVENPTNNPFYSIKFETQAPDGIRDGEYDIFEFTLNQDPGEYTFRLELTRGNGDVYMIIPYEQTVTSDDFTVEYLYKIDNGDGTYTIGFNVTNDDSSSGAALSHVAFELPCISYCDPMLVNNGAEVTVETTTCTLHAKTEQVIFDIIPITDGIGNIDPNLPIITQAVQAFCNPE